MTWVRMSEAIQEGFPIPYVVQFHMPGSKEEFLGSVWEEVRTLAAVLRTVPVANPPLRASILLEVLRDVPSLISCPLPRTNWSGPRQWIETLPSGFPVSGRVYTLSAPETATPGVLAVSPSVQMVLAGPSASQCPRKG
jgi:hypothetical protein